MPGKIKVKVLAGRNLPVMDRASDTTDAFVEIKFGGITHKTDVCRKSLNPHWSSTEWYRFEVDESELQDEPLQLRLMDHDTYSANDAIGKVVISLAPLLAREANNAKGTTGPPGGAVLSGWIPVFDTMHGIRGELNVIVKVELFSDFNKYKTSSCGVQFFHCPMIPPGYKATSIHGFVEELVVNDDPEYQWIDKIRTPRASNEARQVAFIKLSNQVQRLVGLKAAELGANAVVGYQQEFDLEGEAGVVARAIGTAVSITPLPTPSQPVNMISCSQQQLKQCLDILATDDESVTDLSQYYRTHQEELEKMITILNPKGLSMLDSQETADNDDDKIELVRQSSLNSYAGSASLYQDNYVSQKSMRHLSEDQTDLNRLLSRKNEDDSSSSEGPIEKIKKLKTNFFTKRFTKRKGDKQKEKQEDCVSIKSNSSDTSRISMIDIKNEFKKFKKLKKPKIFLNKEEEGEGMASILARSVIHARTSLACIAETQDSENSPCSTMRRQTSESNPTINFPDDDKKITVEKVVEEILEAEDKKVPEIHFSSLKNITSEDLPSHEPRVRKLSESCPTSPMAGRSDNLLKLPGEVGYFGSVSSALSGESSLFSSSEDDEESSDLRTDTDEAFETTSSIVQSVMKHEADPAFIAQMDRKLNILQNTPPKTTESVLANFDLRSSPPLESACLVSESDTIEASKAVEKETTDTKIAEDAPNNEPSTSPKEAETCVSKPNSHHIKLHNPFANRKAATSISCPSSPVEKHNFVYRSSKRIKDKLAKISKSHMIKSISHISLFPKKKHESKTLSQPGSSSDMGSTCPSKYPSETVLGSHFLSYSDLLGLDKNILEPKNIFKSDEIGSSKFSMYIGSEPCSRASLSGPSFNHKDDHDHYRKRPSLKPTGLVHTAMETMLIDKVQSLLIPTSPEPSSANTKFFNDVSERLQEHKNAGLAMGNLQSTVSSTTPRIVAVTPKRLSEDLTAKISYLENKNQTEESNDLSHNAKNTLSIDKMPSMNSGTTESIHTTESLHEDTMVKKREPRGSISALIDKIHLPHPHFFHHKKEDAKSHDIKSGGLIQAAMQTILIDKAQVMIPDTPEPIPIRASPDFGEFGKHHRHHDHTHDKDKDSTGLIHSALSTMLIDNIQAVLPETSEPIPIHTEPIYGEKEIHKHEKDSSGLIHSALQTMLIDNVQSVLPESLEPVPINIDLEFGESEHKHDHTKNKESTGLVHSALQTILIDNVQSVLPGTNEPILIHTEPSIDDSTSLKDNHSNDKPCTGLVHSALQTMLIDNVQSVLPDSSEPIPINLTDIDTEPPNISYSKSKESTGLVHSALQTMLIENVQSVLPGTNEPVPINLDTNTNDENAKHVKVEHTDLVHSALQTILLDKAQSLLTSGHKNVVSVSERKDFEVKTIKNDEENKAADHTAMENIIVDGMQTTLQRGSDVNLHQTQVQRIQSQQMKTEKNAQPVDDSISGILESDIKGIDTDEKQTFLDIATEKPLVKSRSPKLKRSKSKNKEENLKLKGWSEDTSVESTSKQKKGVDNSENTRKDLSKIKRSSEDRRKDLVRQDSIHSVTSTKTSDETNTPCKAPVLQHFHPLLSGPKIQLETIPSADCSIERSIDDETNSASVCDNSHAACRFDRSERDRDVRGNEKGSPRHARHESYGGRDPAPGGAQQNSSLNASSTPMGIHRRSSDSDLSVTPKGGSLNTSVGNNVGSGGGAILRPSMNSNNLDMLEYPFLTMTEYPPGFIVHIGGAVCARSVKLVDGGGESAARAAWWAELRTELRAHARALRCNAVIAYRDTAAICEDVCVLSASGTAAVINLDCDFNADLETTTTVLNGPKSEEPEADWCSIAHVPYSPGSGPYIAELSTCGSCRRARVPAVLLAACAKPNKLAAYPKAVNLTAVAARIRRAPPSAEPGARDISDQLPFLEYELHKLLLAKLRMQGANALFSLQTQIAIGERCVMALASGTAVKLTALPPPAAPRIKATEMEKDALEMQKALWDTFAANKAANGYDVCGPPDVTTNGVLPEVDREEPPVLDLCADKDACVLELDEAEDVEAARLLAKKRIHIQAFTNSLKPAAGAQPLAFTQVSRARLVLSSGVGAGAAAERQVARALDGAAYKLHRLSPVAINAAFHLELPEDEIQLVVSGTAIPLADPSKPDSSEGSSQTNSHSGSQTNSQNSQSSNSQNSQDDDIFELDEEQLSKPPVQDIVEDKSANNGQAGSFVSLTTLSQVGAGRVLRRLCALRLLFVRETTAVRELGGLSGFLHTFTCEVLAILRAYTAALGGNALTSFYITQLMLQDNAHKNQGQCLLSVGGDVVLISY